MTTTYHHHLTTAPLTPPDLARFDATVAHPVATLSVINVPAASAHHRTEDIWP
jgi:hypothetical protein